MSETTLDTLDHNGLVKIKADGNKDVSASIGVYRGNPAFSVFTKSGPPTYRFSLNFASIALLRVMLWKLKKEPRPVRQPITTRDWDGENRKWVPKGTFAVGIDDNLNLYLEASGNGLPARFKFLVKIGPGLDYSEADLSEKDILIANIMALENLLDVVIPTAQRLSSVKRQQNGGGQKKQWNNNGGGNNYRSNSYAGSNSGGGGGGTVIDEEEFM